MAVSHLSMILIIVFLFTYKYTSHTYVVLSYLYFLSISKMCSDIIRSQQTTLLLNHAVRSGFTSPITKEISLSNTIVEVAFVVRTYILKAPNREKDRKTDPVPASPANQTATSDFSSPFSLLSPPSRRAVLCSLLSALVY